MFEKLKKELLANAFAFAYASSMMCGYRLSKKDIEMISKEQRYL